MKEIFNFIKDFTIAITPIVLAWFLWQQNKIKKVVTEVKDKVVEVKDTVVEVKTVQKDFTEKINGHADVLLKAIAASTVEAIKDDPEIDLTKK